MTNALFRVPQPFNEPVRAYGPGDPHRSSLKTRLDAMASERIEIPCVIDGKEVRTGNKRTVVMPHDHRHVLAEFHLAGPREMELAVQAAMRAKASWETMGWQDRAAVFLKAADLLAGSWRDTLNAATMLGQSKSVYQAEIDSACELVDFLRFNAFFYQQILDQQPISPAGSGIWNRMEYRALDGFVLAITPFNFTAIAGNLPAAPAMLGNAVLWKPSDTQMLAAYYTMRLFREAGLPDGVINFIPADGPIAGETLLPMRDLAGVHFTGSTATFNSIWKSIGTNLPNYASYPRIVGETGGKDFVFAHSSADMDTTVTALIRGAFEYQGQKCSAASRAYLPKSLWSGIRDQLISELKTIRMGDVRDFGCFMNAVIDERAFKKITSYLDHARNSNEVEILTGGKADSKEGFFIEPTVIQTMQPKYKSMVDEIFGPVLTVYVYEDSKLDETLKLCDESTSYALTGAILAQDRKAVEKMSTSLLHAAGNFYINDKPTGAVVGQQPFGGSRHSGTNDKAGSAMNLYRWLSPRVVKETLSPPKNYRYPFLG